MKEQRYLVLDESKNGGDSECKVFPTIEEANSYAESEWSYLTEDEKKNRHIHVGLVRLEDLSSWAEDEETGDIDWTAYEQYDIPEGAFDSEGVISQ